jgi:crotonobetainyl-CoA:carnitine CoA-transferase CaiB-like acyl-CoA transferase
MGNEDYNNGFIGAIAVLMGLEHRGATGEGQYIEMPQLHSSLLVTTEQPLDAEGNLVPGLAMDPEQMGWSSLYRLYRTADGWICIACVGDGHWGRLRQTLGLAGLGDVSFAEAVAADDRADLVIKTLTDRLAELTSDDAFGLLDGNGIPCEIPLGYPIMPDLLWEDWALDRGLVIEHQDTEYGYVREVGFTCHLSDAPNVNKGPAPKLGQHSVEILGELGYEPGRIDELVATGKVLVPGA